MNELFTLLLTVITLYWNEAPLKQIPFAQVEQESSWKVFANLSTYREVGKGLSQITSTRDKYGRERFNNFKEAVKLSPLKSWDWQADPYNPKYQLTYLILTDKTNFIRMRKWMVNDAESWKAGLVCYNAGLGKVMQRRANAKLKGLPVDRWAGGLEDAYTKAEEKLLYGRPLKDAVNEYPKKIFKRSKKYEGVVLCGHG